MFTFFLFFPLRRVMAFRPGAGETPFKRSIESPSAWMSPWFFNSFLPGPRIDTEISIEVVLIELRLFGMGKKFSLNDGFDCIVVFGCYIGHWILFEPEGKKP